MLHASALDAEGQRLFVTLATDENAGAIGVIDLTSDAMTVIPEGAASDYHDELLCMHWDKTTNKLHGVFTLNTLTLHALDPDAQAWDDDTPIANLPSDWNALGGNSAVVSAFDADKRLLYFMAGTEDARGNLKFDLAALDVDSATVVAHPPLADVGMAKCTDCVAAMVLA